MKKIIRRPAVDVGHCLFCGNCMEYCPTDAWNFTQEFELADYAREDLYYRADELRMPKENSDKEIVLINRIGEHPILEVDVCIGCRKCERECPTRCIDMLDGPNDRKGKPIVIPEFDYTKCIGCQQCVDVCPVDCLHMEEIGYKDLEGFYHINLQAKSSCSRNRSKSSAPASNRDYSYRNCRPFILFPLSISFLTARRAPLGPNHGCRELSARRRHVRRAVPVAGDCSIRQGRDQRRGARRRGARGRQSGPAGTERGRNRSRDGWPDLVV